MPFQDNCMTGNAIFGFRFKVCLSAMKLYLNHGLKASRNATPANLRAIASEFTGKSYARSRKGLETAYSDMLALQDGKSLDELGEIRAVNTLVGGVASDLQ